MQTRTHTLFLLGALVAATACQGKTEEPRKKPKIALSAVPAGVEIDSAKTEMFGALPESMESKTNPLTEEKVSLGRMLFYDTRLSKNHDLSCNSCHDLDKFGADSRDVSLGHRQQKGARNSPTVYNAALQFVQFWDGRAETVEDQSKGPMENPSEMGASGSIIVSTLQTIPAYVDAFKRAFPDDAQPLTFDNVAKALGAFERKLVTPSRWDQFLKGEKSALTDDEKKGFLKFVEVGCPTCHVGPLVGGTMYQKLGKERPWPNQADKGRSMVTKSPSDDMMFRVSQLRNIEKTAPYFHDASGKTLEGAIKTMASTQLAKDISDDDARSMATWLKTLTGTIPADLIKKPALPESTATTPKPNPK